MNAAITSVYSVIAVCTPWIVVSRSSTICEIATFMTLESSTMTNWAEARMSMGSHLRTTGTLTAGSAAAVAILDGSCSSPGCNARSTKAASSRPGERRG